MFICNAVPALFLRRERKGKCLIENGKTKGRLLRGIHCGSLTRRINSTGDCWKCRLLGPSPDLLNLCFPRWLACTLELEKHRVRAQDGITSKSAQQLGRIASSWVPSVRVRSHWAWEPEEGNSQFSCQEGGALKPRSIQVSLYQLPLFFLDWHSHQY